MKVISNTIVLFMLLSLFSTTLSDKINPDDSQKQEQICLQVESTSAAITPRLVGAHILLVQISAKFDVDKQLAPYATAISHASELAGQLIDCRYLTLSDGESVLLTPQLTPQLPVAHLLLVGQSDWQPLLLTESEITSDRLLARITEQPAVVQDLEDANFEGLTQAATGSTTGHWLVSFLDPKDAQLDSKSRILNGLAQSLRPMHVSVARVLLNDASLATTGRFSASSNSLLLLRSGAYYNVPHHLHSWRLILAFARHGYSDAKRIQVPSAPTPFDHAVDAAVAFLLSFNGVAVSPVHIAICAGLFVLLAGIICLCLCAKKGLAKVTKTD